MTRHNPPIYKSRSIRMVFATILLSLFFSGCAQAENKIGVTPDDNLQAIVDAATAPVTLLLSEGVFDQTLRFRDKDVSLIGAGDGKTILRNSNDQLILWAAAAKLTVTGITLEPRSKDGLAIAVRDGTSLTLADCVIEGGMQAQVFATNAAALTVSRCIFSDFSGAAILSDIAPTDRDYDQATILIENSHFKNGGSRSPAINITMAQSVTGRYIKFSDIAVDAIALYYSHGDFEDMIFDKIDGTAVTASGWIDAPPTKITDVSFNDVSGPSLKALMDGKIAVHDCNTRNANAAMTDDSQADISLENCDLPIAPEAP